MEKQVLMCLLPRMIADGRGWGASRDDAHMAVELAVDEKGIECFRWIMTDNGEVGIWNYPNFPSWVRY